MGLDNGMEFYRYLTHLFRYFYPDGPLEGAGYSALLHEGWLYFSMNTGIYSIPWQKYYMPDEKSNATLIQGTKGQVWSLNKLEDLLAGHHSGAFQIKVTKHQNFQYLRSGNLLISAIAYHWLVITMAFHSSKINERWTLKHTTFQVL